MILHMTKSSENEATFVILKLYQITPIKGKQYSFAFSGKKYLSKL